jgi:hypothetical protein
VSLVVRGEAGDQTECVDVGCVDVKWMWMWRRGGDKHRKRLVRLTATSWLLSQNYQLGHRPSVIGLGSHLNGSLVDMAGGILTVDS